MINAIQSFNDRVKQIEKTLGIINFLQDEKLLYHFLFDLKMELDHLDYLSLFSHLTANFSNNHQEKLACYFNHELDFNTLGHEFINFIYNENAQLVAKLQEKTLSAGNNVYTLGDYFVKKMLLTKKWNRAIDILGFGSGGSSFDLGLKNFLIQTGQVDHVNLYGFDPYETCAESVISLSENELIENNEIKFDLIIANWVLHHIPAEQRWDVLSQTIKKLKKNGLVLFLEHGFIDEKHKLQNEDLYRLLNLLIDIVSNIYFHPHWLADTKPDYGKNYYIDFLYTKDINNIIKKTGGDYKTMTIGPLFPWQTFVMISKIK